MTCFWSMHKFDDSEAMRRQHNKPSFHRTRGPRGFCNQNCSPRPGELKRYTVHGKVIELEEDILESHPGFHRASFPQVGGGYELTVSWPMAQSVGDFDGIDFYFRAKYGEWEFQTENKEGHSFPEGHPNYFVRRGTYVEKKPSALSIEWSLRILRKCFVEFWNRPV